MLNNRIQLSKCAANAKVIDFNYNDAILEEHKLAACPEKNGV